VEELRGAVADGQAKLAVAKVTEGLDGGVEAGTLLREGLIEAMAQVGKLYEEGDIFVPEMLVAARAMTGALTVLKPDRTGIACGALATNVTDPIIWPDFGGSDMKVLVTKSR
jgi:methanogenic corrinoid protein MtbC1